MRIADCPAWEVPLYDLTNVPTLLRARRLRRLVADLQSARGVQADRISDALLVKLAANDYRLVWSTHHLVVDAYCWRILLEDLSLAYQHPDAELPRATGFDRYLAVIERDFALAGERHRPAWEKLANAPRLVLPCRGEDNEERRLATLVQRVDAEKTSRLLDATRAGDGYNLHLLLLTALCLGLRSWAGTDRVSLDIISNGRDIDPTVDFSRTIGWFATHNPFAVELDGEGIDALRRVDAAWQSHKEISPYFVEACNRSLDSENDPLRGYNDNAVLYNFLGMFDSMSIPDDWHVLGAAGQDRAGCNRRTHDIEFEAMVLHGRLMVSWHYGQALFSRGVMRRLASSVEGHLLGLAERLVREP